MEGEWGQHGVRGSAYSKGNILQVILYCSYQYISTSYTKRTSYNYDRENE